MENIKNLFQRNRHFLFGFMLFFFAGLLFVMYTSKADSFLYLNAYHNSALNIFFIAYTNLGDGLFIILIVLFLLGTKRFEIAWQLLASFVASGLIAQVFKYFIYSPRPKLFFSEKEHIHLIEGITRTGTSSFPSGHTASVFALVTILALFANNKKICAVYLIPAILVAYSRIYLAQHFLTDVLAGSLIGVATAVVVYHFFNVHSTNKQRRRIMRAQTQVEFVEPSRHYPVEY